MKNKPQPLSREDKVFLSVCDYNLFSTGNYDSSADDIDELIDTEFNWDYFLRLARHNNFLALVYRFFSDIGKLGSLPRNISSSLAHEYTLAQARYLKKSEELSEILQVMEKDGIEPIVFKGIAIANLLYRDPGTRVSKDTDILVHPSEVEKARGVLEYMGYSIYTGTRSEEDYRDYHFHYIFTRGEHMDSVVELHWSLVYPARMKAMGVSSLKEKATTIEIQDYKIKTLSPQDYLWYMSVHLSFSYFLNFRNVLEIRHLAIMLNEEEIEYAREFAEHYGTSKELNISITLAELLFGKFTYDEISQEFEPGFILNNFAIKTYYPRGLLWNWTLFRNTHELIISLLLRKGIKNKFVYLYNLLFPSRGVLSATHFELLVKRSSSKIVRFKRGMVILIKVIFSTFFLGILVQNGIFKEHFQCSNKNFNVNN